MEFFEVIKKRRSIRCFTEQKVADEVVVSAIDAAVLAPNSSNTQTWNFYWVKSDEKKAKLVEYCLSQSAARTAQGLIVITADPKLWKRSQPGLVKWAEDAKAPQQVKAYYEKLIPFTYRWGFLNSLFPLKWLICFSVGLFRPFMRGPNSLAELQMVAIKSAALAAENFVLALTAQGVSSCMMEGFDETRVKRLLGLGRSARVVMVIGFGYEGERARWGPQFRIPTAEVFHVV